MSRQVSAETRGLIDDGGFDHVFVADLMYNGDRRLRDVQTLCRRHKAASANNFKEGTGKFNIHKSSLGHVLYQYLRYQFALYFIIAAKLRSSYSPPLINGSPHPHDDSRNIFSA